jgi:exosortase
MTDTKAFARTAPWPVLIGLGGFWFVLVRMFSPQWTFYEQYNYGWAVPFLCAYLLWNRWADRPQPAAEKNFPVLALLAACALLLLPTRIVVEANPIWRAGSWALGLEVVAMTLCLFSLAGGVNWLKHFWFPVVFFLVAIPWPSQWENMLVQNLMRLDTGIVVEILGVIGVPALQRGSVIEISTGLVGIDEACSGIRSLQATLMIGLFFGELYRLSSKRRVAMIASGMGLAFLCNVARTLTLVLVSSKSGNEVMNRWHDPTGISILVVCFTGLWLIALKLKPAANPVAQRNAPQPAWPQIQPRFVSTGLVVWLVMVEAGNAAWFGLREQADPNLTNWSMRWPADKSNLRELQITQNVAAQLRYDEGHSMGWSEPDGTVWQMFYFRWKPARSLLERVRMQSVKTHRPEICLPGAGLTLRTNLGVKEFEAGGLSLPFNAYVFDDRGLSLHVYFCAWEDGPLGVASNMRESTASRLQAALAGSRSVSQRTLEIAMWGCRDSQEADAALLRQLRDCIQR